MFHHDAHDRRGTIKKDSMRQWPTARRLPAPTLPALLISLVLAGCGSSPQIPPTVQLPPEVKPVDSAGVGPLMLPPSDFAPQFAAAESALLQFDWMSAETALASVPPDDMSGTDRTYRLYLEARIHHLRGDEKAANSTAQSALAGNSDPALASKIMNFQRYRTELAGDYLASATLADRLLATARTPEAADALKRTTWHNLQRLDDAELQAALRQAGDPRMEAWLQLAILSRTDSITRLTSELQQWQAAHPDHPAAAPLPGGLGHLLDGPGPAKVALMLPLSGRLAPAGEAIRDGFLARYYAALAEGNPQPELLVLDRLRFESAGAAYQAAVQLGAGLVVGPLTRASVVALGQEPRRPVPILALNRADTPLPPGDTALVQLSLAPEDEAQHLASLAFGRGARRALLLRPAGDWGDKMERALRERWQSLGGTVAESAAYSGSEDYAKSMTAALGLNASEQRSRDLRSRLALSKELEFTPRRRQDLDAVFLLSRSPNEAQALKPLLGYYYAGDLPVYATSSIHRGNADPANKDLDGIKLVDLPWLLGSNPGLRLAITAGDTGSDVYTRLNALGADAHRLQSLFRQLQGGADALVRGDTGLLTLDPQLRIVREPRLATFDGGELKPE
jgi:outer membrane PBP1 activator LpoA protein